MPPRDLRTPSAGKRELFAVTDGCCLRLLTESDLPLTLVWRNRDHVRRWFLHSDPLTPEAHRAWFEEYQRRDNDFLFIIEKLSADGRTSTPVGQTSLYNIDWSRGTGESGRVIIAEKCRLAATATCLAIDVGFAELGLNEIHADVYAHNLMCLALCARCGFVRMSEQNGLVRLAIQRRDWLAARDAATGNSDATASAIRAA
jgi:RimJ/RimL family protein N-acetyltransferase